ncbi:hypothetical protein CLAFUW4_11062 [Fulvia fulva]|uniref:Uncharacterized protein n=1 Tax=Passalora fulva TaxID=5499 RepID=A0A9Q8PCQ0_PASFU|nr:uncharacterized protein CLAFUR5_10104 [Fulvia fulva]KAK4619324.1 hypothetical protein CLAFUR4_11067 [Fulvia fulva]KAK4620602.1 hypothetical protein CLAFUR0_11073 [Fulvia fulva]UJO20038.1 hypothetical protein CLAFUR5_10104 [Fulvia fulva]WPV17519.1 hypothetical protein CLAFUW4_11062 [Fulvia fulva]WPV32369.1 hypothetical protein CLAFUW7_11059 [Fulvia fulva]
MFMLRYLLNAITREQFRVAYRAALEEVHQADGISDDTKHHLIKNANKLAHLAIRTRSASSGFKRWRDVQEYRNAMRAARLLKRDSELHKGREVLSYEETQLICGLTTHFRERVDEPLYKLYYNEDEPDYELYDYDEDYLNDSFLAMLARLDACDEEKRKQISYLKGHMLCVTAEERRSMEPALKHMEQSVALGDQWREWRKKWMGTEIEGSGSSVLDVEASSLLQLIQ